MAERRKMNSWRLLSTSFAIVGRFNRHSILKTRELRRAKRSA